MRKRNEWGATPDRRRNPARGRKRWLLSIACVITLWYVCGYRLAAAYTIPTVFGKYKLDASKTLGTGAYGSVYRCVDKEGVERAVKVIPMWSIQEREDRHVTRSKLQQEVDVHQHIGAHRNIIRLVDDIEIPGTVQGWPRWKMIVFELARGGDLGDLMELEGKLDEKKSKLIFRQLVDAVQHVHSRKVIHRDLKTNNILLTFSPDNDNFPLVKLIDFGAGHWSRSGPLEASECVGTLATMAPEVIAARGDEADLSNANEIMAIHEVEYRIRPFGVQEYAPGPKGKGARILEIREQERYPGDPLGQAWKNGVRVGWWIKSVGGIDVTNMDFEQILDLMGDRLLDNSSRGAFDGSYKVTGDNYRRGRVRPKVQQVELPAKVEYAEMKPRTYDAKADVWSLGVVLYQMVAGGLPFPADGFSVRNGQYQPVHNVSADLSDLLGKMLALDPEARLHLADVAKHPWLN